VRVLAVALVLAACATGSRLDEAPDAARPDGSTAGIDAPAADDAPVGSDAPVAPSGAALLITEVVLAPSTGEYIEIANPTSQTVDLSTYYLADSGVYFRLPAGPPAVDVNDFVVRFPAGATIAPGAVVTVALDTAANFQLVYGAAPTFSIASATMTSIAANGVGTLTNAGELAVLFQWSGQADLVRDVDLVLVGVPTAANGLVDKSAQAFDGPDSDSATSAYGPDARTIAAQATTPASGRSTKRVALETGHETQTGSGNGIVGDDETSEDTASTWDTVYSVPTPGALPAGLL